MQVLDGPADDVAAVELGEREGPGHLRQQRQEGRQDVGDGQVQDEEVHPGHLVKARQAAGVKKEGEIVNFFVTNGN